MEEAEEQTFKPLRVTVLIKGLGKAQVQKVTIIEHLTDLEIKNPLSSVCKKFMLGLTSIVAQKLYVSIC